MKKKFISSIIVIIFITCISAFIINKVLAVTTDTVGPNVNSISIVNHDYNPGDKVTFSIDVEDDVSGVARVLLAYFGENDSTKAFVKEANFINNEWSITLPINLSAQVYNLIEVSTVDNANNERRFRNETPTDPQYEYLDWDMDLNIIADSSDIEPPVVSDVTLDKTELLPGEEATITAKITDNSIIKSSSIVFHELGMRGLNSLRFQMLYDYESGLYKGKFIAPNVQKTFELQSIMASDVYDNWSMYMPVSDDQSSCIDEAYQFCNLSPMTIKVNGSVADNNAPTISKVSFDKEKVSAPSTIKAYIEASDDVSGLSQSATIEIERLAEDGTFIQNSRISYEGGNVTLNPETGKYEGVFNISQYNQAGTYAVSRINIKDNAGNEITYNSSQISSSLISFQIVESLEVDLVTGTTAKDIAKKIREADDYANIMIDSSSVTKISKDIFDAIKGTNKTIYIETAGIQWVFNGKDITETKDIDVNTTINMISQSDTYNISDVLEKAIVITFAENGELPGKALIRVKADYAFRNYIGIDDLQVYYYDNTDKMFVKVKLSTALSDDGFYEFYIDHNSVFVLTNKAPAAKYLKKTLADLALNDSTITADQIKASEESDFNMSYLIYAGIGALVLAILITTIVVIKKRSPKKIKDNSKISDIILDDNNQTDDSKVDNDLDDADDSNDSNDSE